MSTKFTKQSPNAGYELVDSRSLALTQAMGGFQARISDWLLLKLQKQGFEQLTASSLGFLGALDCGQNHGSNLARVLGISRQAVHKTVRELEGYGWLYTRPDAKLGNQKVIVFTGEGERMMAVARQYFADMDAALLSQFGDNCLDHVLAVLEFDPSRQP